MEYNGINLTKQFERNRTRRTNIEFNFRFCFQNTHTYFASKFVCFNSFIRRVTLRRKNFELAPRTLAIIKIEVVQLIFTFLRRKKAAVFCFLSSLVRNYYYYYFILFPMLFRWVH